MKHVFLFIFFACNHLILLAQDNGSFQIDWGTQFPLKRTEDFFVQKLCKSDTLYTAHTTKKGNFIRAYDLKSNRLIKETPINPVYKNQTYVLIDNIVFGDQMLFLSFYWDKATKNDHYVLHTLEDGKISNPTDLLTLPDDYSPYNNYDFQVQKHWMVPFEHSISDNGQFLMIFFYEPTGLLGNNMKTQTYLLNRSLQIVDQGQIDWQNNASKSYQLSNNGKLFFSRLDELGIYDGDTSLFFPIEFPKIPKSWNFKVFRDNSVLVFGYSQNPKSQALSSVFFFQLDSNYLVKNKVIQEIRQDLLPVQEHINGDFRYNIHDLILKENGEIVLLLEQYAHGTVEHVYVYQNGSTSRKTYDTHFFGHIVTVNYDKAGKIMEYSYIPRNQQGYGNSTDKTSSPRVRLPEKSPSKKNYTSFFYFQKENDVYLIYDPQITYKDLSSRTGKIVDYLPGMEDTTPLRVAIIKNSGAIQFQNLYGYNSGVTELLIPMLCFTLNNKQFYIAALEEKKKKVGFAKVTLK